jgi:hypothetical protein
LRQWLQNERRKMKPDWQNKSFAKGGAATGPSTMHSKLKVGMSNLHSKIAQANNNMPQAPKPVVRKFADGGSVRTRSDDEIGDTNPRTGQVDPGSFERRQKAGEENMARLRSAADSIKSFFTPSEKASSSNITGDTGMSASDAAKKAAMSGGAQMPAPAEEKRREMTDYMVKPTETESKTEIQATPVETGASPTPAPAPAKKTKAAKTNANVQKSSAPATKTEVKMSGSPDMPSSNVKATPSTQKASAPVTAKPAAPVGKTYRTLDGKIARTTTEVEKPLDQQWGMHNVVPNAKRYAGAVADYVKNFETPAERRSRLAKEGK